MKIERIEITNWLPFAGKARLDLPAGPIAVVGCYSENPRRSNWSGKTAFLEAIDWCFFGTHRKRYDDDVIHDGTDFVEVVVHLTGAISVKRSRKRGKPTRLLVQVGAKSFRKKEAQQQIEKILGFDSTDYRATQCFAQGDTTALIESTSSERRKVVGQWLELEAWERIAARIRVQSRGSIQSLSEVKRHLEEIESSLSELSIEEIASNVGTIAGKIRSGEDLLEERETLAESIAEAEMKRLDSERLAKKRERLAELRDAIKKANPGEVKRRLEVISEEAQEANAQATFATTDLEAARAFKRGDFDGECPVMRAPCPAAQEVRENRDAAATRYEEAREAAKAATALLDEKKRALVAAQRDERQLDRLRTSYVEVTGEAKRLKEAIESYDAADTDVDPSALREEISKIRVSLRQLRDSLREWRGLEAEHATLTKLAEDRRMAIDDLEEETSINALALKAVGSTGIPAMIAEASLAELEDRGNHLLTGTGLSFAFSWDRVTKDVVSMCPECGYSYRGKKDKSCPACNADRPKKRAEDLEILVSDGSGVVEDVKAKSGGAKVLVGSAIRLAAGLMLRERRGSPFAVAQVDEPFGPLDAENRETLARTFAGMLGAVGLEQAFVVSHDANLLASLPHRIVIEREGDLSTARME